MARLVDGERQTMRKVALLVFIAAFAPQAGAAARGGIKVLNSIPDAYWGTWAPGVGPCKDGDTEAIVLSAKAYAGPLGKCDVASVSETPSRRGATSPPRLRGADPGKKKKKPPANPTTRLGDPTQFPVAPT